MNQFCDIRGLSLTASSQAAVDKYDEAFTAVLEYRSEATKQLKSALAMDPNMPMAICLQGYLFLMIGTNGVADKANAAFDAVSALAADANDRERLHISALGAWIKRDEVQACAIWYRILTLFPFDLLAIRLLHATSFWMGNAALLRNSTASIYPNWDPKTPGFGFVLGMYAFGLEESGDYVQAESLGRQAIEMNPDDLWAVHSVAHVFEMQGRIKEGKALLTFPSGLDDRNPFRGHIWWHKAMFCLDLRQYDEVLEIYDESIHAIESTFYLDVQNTASLLARLECVGVDVGDRWDALADIAEQQIGDHVLAFTEMHYALALGAAGRIDAMIRHQQSLGDFSHRQSHWSAQVARLVGLPLCDAIGKYTQGNYSAFVDQFSAIRYDLARTGGSHAQRDLFEQLYLNAAIQDGQFHLARSIVSERLSKRPDNANNWDWYAKVLTSMGDHSAANDAQNRAQQLLK